MTYKTRLNEMAENMAQIHNGMPLWSFLCVHNPDKVKRQIISFIPLARIALSFGAECYQDGHHDGYMDAKMQYEETVDQHLITNGLKEQ